MRTKTSNTRQLANIWTTSQARKASRFFKGISFESNFQLWLSQLRLVQGREERQKCLAEKKFYVEINGQQIDGFKESEELLNSGITVTIKQTVEHSQSSRSEDNDKIKTDYKNLTKFEESKKILHHDMTDQEDMNR